MHMYFDASDSFFIPLIVMVIMLVIINYNFTPYFTVYTWLLVLLAIVNRLYIESEQKWFPL